MTPQNTKKHSKFKFDNWKFDSHKSTLSSSSNECKLPKLQNDLLCLFVNQPKTVLSREFLIEKLWGDKIVNEEALSRLIAELRKLLNDSAKKPRYIKTLPKKGYEFIQKVEPITALGIKKNHQNLYLILSLCFLVMAFLSWFLISSSSVQQNQALKFTQSLANAKRLTAQPGMERQPVISNNGQKIAYVKYTDKQSIIVLENRTDGTQQELKSNLYNLSSPAFSNNESQLAMAAVNQQGCQVMIIDLKTLEKSLHAGCQIKNNSKILSWSKQDDKIYYTDLETQFNTNAIWELDLASSESKQISFPKSSDLFDSNPNLSPDGHHLSFNRGNHSVQNIYLKKLNSKDSIATNLSKDQNYTVSHVWLDNNSIIYDSDKTGNRKLWRLDIDSKTSQLLGARGAQFPSFSPSANVLAYQLAEYEANIWMVDLNTQSETRLIHSTKYDNNPAFNHSGTQFAFTSNREDHGVIFSYDFLTKTENKIFEIPQTKLTRPVWSKDDSHLIASGNSSEGYWNYELDLKTNEYRKLPFNQENVAGFYFQDEIYALSKPNQGESFLIKLNKQNQTIQLPIKGISRIQAINKQQLVMSKANKPGLFLINTDDFSTKTVIDDFPSTYLNYWTASDSELYYVNQDSNFSIWKFQLKTGQHSKVSEYFPTSVGPTLSVSPDKTKILITKTDRAESDVFIAELGK